jgi:FMN phosphatase YigB (HAD superfamily)
MTAATLVARGRIRGVLFDLDGTLYSQPPLRLAMAAELAMSCVLQPRAARTRLAVLRTYRRMHEELRHADGAEPLSEVQAARTGKRTNVPLSTVQALVDEWMQQRPLKYLRWCRRPGVMSTLDRLRAAGLKLGVLSDYPAQQKLEALGLAGLFSPVLCTTDSEINALKPDPRGFRHACDVWGLLPEEVLYVGDRPEVDGAGAFAAGLPCVIVGSHSSSGGWRAARGFPTLDEVLGGA